MAADHLQLAYTTNDTTLPCQTNALLTAHKASLTVHEAQVGMLSGHLGVLAHLGSVQQPCQSPASSSLPQR